MPGSFSKNILAFFHVHISGIVPSTDNLPTRNSRSSANHTRSHCFVSKLYRLITRAGLPATTEKGGTSFVTTEFAATTQCSPIVTPDST